MPDLNLIPFLDLITPHREMEDSLVSVFRRALSSASFIGGPVVEEFERAFARFCGTACSVAVSSGTDALRFALMACGVTAGDIVVTVSHTFIATTEAISQAGALPEFVDVDETTYNMSVENLHEFLANHCRRDQDGALISLRSGRPVKAIVPVHLYGQMVDMDRVMSLAADYRLMVIEDACQAHGARYYSKDHLCWFNAGQMGHAAAFSFYPGKNLGACGEAGAATTNNPEVAARMRTLRDHGQATKYYHDIEGYNGRLDAIQAGFLLEKLPYLEQWNAQRRERAAEYNRLLANNVAVIRPCEPEWSRAVYHLYVIRVSARERLMQHLKEAGIGSGIHYPLPLHQQKAYQFLNYTPDDLPVTSRIGKEILSLPMFPQLTSEQQARIADEIDAFISRDAEHPVTVAA